MSHKQVGQIEANNQQLNSDSRNTTEENSQSSGTALTDSDYEFLFNQLLEGIAHGWHEPRIVKFFKQLGERGQQHLWLSWLERFGVKTAKIASPSGQQLGALMMRLGELTQSNAEVKEIGALSYQLGQKLLTGNRQDLIWEYDGPDWQPEITPVEPQIDDLEDHDDLSKRLPEEFDEVYQPPASDDLAGVDADISSSELEPTIYPPIDLESEEDSIMDILLDVTEIPEIDITEASQEPENLIIADTQVTEIKENYAPEVSSPEQQENNRTSSDLTTTETKIPTNSQIKGVNWQKFISLIEQDEELVKQIAQKLDGQEIDPQALAEETLAKLEPKSESDTSDQSDLELIQSWFNLGLKQVTAGELASAVNSWEKALKLNPNLSEAWHNRGSALGRLGRYSEAIESFDRALEIAVNNPQAWNDRAHALYQLQKWEAAIVSWSKAIEFMPGNHLFWYNRGCALEQVQRISEAISSYERALEIKPDFQLARSRYVDLIADNSQTN